MSNRRTILVVGATGAQGGGVARHVLAGGTFAVRALTRDPASEAARELARAGASVVRGNLDDPGSLARAVDGCYGVFGVTNYWEHFEREFELGKNLVDAVAASDVKHFVLSTLPSVKEQDPTLDVPHFEMKADLERYTRERGVPATFVHVAFYYENYLTFFPPQRQSAGHFAFGFPQGETPLAGVAAEDIGGVVATIFQKPTEFVGQTIGIAGDDLPPATYADIMTRTLGKPIMYDHIPREVFAGFGFPGAADLAGMFDFNRRYIPKRSGDVKRCRELYPKMHAFEDWLREHHSSFAKILAAASPSAVSG